MKKYGAPEPPYKIPPPPPSRMKRTGEWPSAQCSGTLECMDYAAVMMLELGNMLMVSDKKIRVTIERDPETGRFWAKREEFN